jgi:hypothetical protein
MRTRIAAPVVLFAGVLAGATLYLFGVNPSHQDTQTNPSSELSSTLPSVLSGLLQFFCERLATLSVLDGLRS